MKKILGILTIIALFAGVLLVNVHSLPSHDEIAYAFAGMLTPMDGEVPRTDSIGMLLARQYEDYLHGLNGRVIVHTAVAAFSAAGAYLTFDVVNSLVWMAFVLVLMKLGKVRLTIRNYVIVFLAAFALLWYSQSCSFDSAFAVNYLWMALITLWAISSWDKGTANPLLFFLFGWTQESFVLPFVAAGAADMIFNRPKSWRKPVCWTTMTIGAAFLVLSPSAIGRASSEYSIGLSASIKTMIAFFPRAAFYVAPIILVLALIPIVRRHFFDFDLLYVFAAGAMMICLPKAFSPRLLMAAGAVTFMLALKHRELLPTWTRSPRLNTVSAALIAVWFALTVAMQIGAGRDNKRMFESYARGGDLVRGYSPVVGYTADRGQWSKWHLRLLQLEYAQPKVGTLRANFTTPDWVKKIRSSLPPFAYARIKYLLPDAEALTTPAE